MTISKLVHESQFSINGLESTTKVVLLVYFVPYADAPNTHIIGTHRKPLLSYLKTYSTFVST